MRKICLETSSYLPLIWCTPYSQSLISLIKSYKDESEFYIQKDCILEALSYVHYPNNWFRHAPFRLRKLSKALNDKVLERMSFPSSAFQIVLGGKMWAQGLYLNFVRHTTFLYADLIDKRYSEIRKKIEGHLESREFHLDLNEIYPYWGKYYLYSDELFSFKVVTWDVDEKFEKGVARIRDVFHYQSMINSKINFEKMIVANTGFSKHIKRELKGLPIEIICAASRQTELFE